MRFWDVYGFSFYILKNFKIHRNLDTKNLEHLKRNLLEAFFEIIKDVAKPANLEAFAHLKPFEVQDFAGSQDIISNNCKP